MISLEQIRVLNSKVQKALKVITGLRDENQILRNKLGNYEKRMEELETLVNSFNRDQDDIENGILGILQQLDKLEEDFSSKKSADSSASGISSPVKEADPEKSASLKQDTGSDKLSSGAAAEVPVKTSEPSEPEISPTSGEAELDIF